MEYRLIEIVWSMREDGVDFNIPISHLKIIKRNKKEVIEMLEKLKTKLEKSEYPFQD